MSGIFVRVPKLGDYVCKRKSDRKVFFADWEHPDVPEGNDFEVAGVAYEKLGSAVPMPDGTVGCVWRETATRKWSERYEWLLTGYSLDGEEHSGILSVVSAADKWAVAVGYTFTYSASTLEGFVEQLNAWLASTEPFSAQDWAARIEGEQVRLHCQYTAYNQAAKNKGAGGFTLTESFITETKWSSAMRKRNGVQSGDGAISNWWRALYYFRSDLASATYNPSAPLTSHKRAYAVCLPAYLGESQLRDQDCCEVRRARYGEGEAGWLRFMESLLPVFPTDYGMAMNTDAKAMTALLASKGFTSPANPDGAPVCPAAYYCNSVESATVSKGEYWLPSPSQIARFLDGVKYPSQGANRNLDPLNASRYKAGWVAVANNSNLWSCARSGSRYAWCAGGGVGCFYGNNFYGAYVAVPFSLYPLT